MAKNNTGLNPEQKRRYYHNLEERADEIVSSYKKGEKPKLRRISLHLVSDCSLRCSYCKTRKVDDLLTEVISTESWNNIEVNHHIVKPEVLEIFDSVDEIGLQQMHIIGGEPTLVDNLPSLIERATKKYVNTSLVTNGSTPNTCSEEYIERLINSGLGTLTVSLDHFEPKINDYTVNVLGAWKATVNFIKDVVKKNEILSQINGYKMPVYVNVVVDKYSIAQIPQHIKFLGNLGVDDVKLLIVKKSPQRRMTPETYDGFIDNYLERSLETTRIYGFNMLNDDIHTLLNKDREMRSSVLSGRYYLPFDGPCHLSMTEMAIVSNGDVYTCIYHFWDRKQRIGMNILNMPIREIYSNYYPFKHNDKSVCCKDCTRKVVEINRKISEMLMNEKK